MSTVREIDLFDSEFGLWNITLALADCQLGHHAIWRLGVKEAREANFGVEVDPNKASQIKLSTKALSTPLIAVQFQGALCLIDGHHRLRALDELGVEEFNCWIIEEGNAAKYLI